MRLSQIQLDKMQKDLAFWIKRWSEYPLAYVIECVGDIPTYQQAEILNAVPEYRFVSGVSGHGIGKSKLTGWMVNWYLDCHARPGRLTRVPITGAGGSQLNSTMWAEVNTVNDAKWPFLGKRYKINDEMMYCLESPKTWFAVLRTARVENPDALQGFHECFFVIDEGSAVPDKIFEVARGAMGDPGSYGLMLGNPTRTSGYMYEAHHNPDSVWHCMQFSSEDSIAEEEYSYDYVDPMGNIITITHNGRQTRKWVKDMKTEFGENSNVYRIRVLGKFANESQDLVVESRWLNDIENNPKNAENAKHLKIMGVDVGYTSDPSGAVIRQGMEIYHIEEWKCNGDTTITEDKVIKLQEEFECDKIGVDPIGVGAGVYDNLRKKGLPVYKADVREVAPTPNDAKCDKLRDWLWWKCRHFFQKCTVHINSSINSDTLKKLKKEVCYPTYTTEGNKLKVESKKDMKKRGLKSPNIADALNITFLQDFPKEVVKHNPKNKRKKKRKRNNFKTV